MRRNTDWMDELKAVARARELASEGNYKEARDAMLALRAERHGKESAYLLWSLAIACDHLEEFDMAMECIEEAIARDPLCLPVHESFDVIADRIRKSLTAETHAADDPSTPHLYRLLLASGEASMHCHIAMARFHATKGEFPAALKLLEAVTTLEPGSPLAWRAMLEVAGKAGDADLVARAQVEVASTTDDGGVPFSIPGRAEG